MVPKVANKNEATLNGTHSYTGGSKVYVYSLNWNAISVYDSNNGGPMTNTFFYSYPPLSRPKCTRELYIKGVEF